MKCNVTYEELAALAAGDLPEDRAAELQAHAAECDHCRERLGRIRSVDAGLLSLRREEPSAHAVLEARRALSRELGRSGPPEVMTLEEVAEFLRVDDLGEVVEHLPAFEIAGQVRVRRAKLLEWIESRERAFARSSIESEVAGILAGLR